MFATDSGEDTDLNVMKSRGRLLSLDSSKTYRPASIELNAKPPRTAIHQGTEWWIGSGRFGEKIVVTVTRLDWQVNDAVKYR